MRVPCSPATSLSIHAEFRDDITPDQAREILASAPGVALEEVDAGGTQAAGNDPSYVGRIRADQSAPGKGLVLFISNDNLLVGPERVQIAELVAARLGATAA